MNIFQRCVFIPRPILIFNCIGKLYVDGVYICDTIEDKDWSWNKDTPLKDIQAIKKANKSKTAIPRGTYFVTIDIKSPKFRQYTYYRKFCDGKLPRLLDVKGFEGILIHGGYSERSSAGCIIVGYNTVKGQVTDWQKAFESLYRLLQHANEHKETITIEIK